MATVHKRKLSGGQVAKKMWKKWRINPDLIWFHHNCRASFGVFENDDQK
jgi:hypothetical protein